MWTVAIEIHANSCLLEPVHGYWDWHSCPCECTVSLVTGCRMVNCCWTRVLVFTLTLCRVSYTSLRYTRTMKERITALPSTMSGLSRHPISWEFMVWPTRYKISSPCSYICVSLYAKIHLCVHGDHWSGKPRSVSEFDSSVGKVGELTKRQGLSGNKSCQRKLFIVYYTFEATLALTECRRPVSTGYAAIHLLAEHLRRWW